MAELLTDAAKLCGKAEYARAFVIYRQLAESGHLESQVFLGWMLAAGKGVQANREQAVYWFRRAARLGSASGAFYLGRLLTKEAKHAEAVDWYRRSAREGYSPSQYWLGLCYLRALGVPKDLALACRYLEPAKANGHFFAWRELAVLDIQGRRGVARRLLGVGDFLLVLLFGSAVAFYNPYSDSLRA
ncbi:tetratricopeptide repeat protein [Ralstonia pickettii]|uniref:tetratricopeptide repeat protein n=1 Tax=Ralstonia pickettii TaxID=329 RepID=UPI0015DF4CF6|nr:tetratricopeptide repeat protein [Ralstonia pickettii]